MKQVDLVILGAGPAGSAAAVTARRAGLSVVLIDKARFPRDKLCGGLVTGRCAAHLARIFGQAITEDLFDTRRNFEFFMQGQDLGRLDDVPPLHLTMRRAFDAQLLGHARAAGAQDYTGHRVSTLDLAQNRVTLDRGEPLSFKALIGADGVQSIVAKELFSRAFDPARVGFALEIEAPAQTATLATPIRIDFAAARWGYGWSFPKRGSTTVGVAGLHTHNPDMKPCLSTYLDLLDTGQGAKIKGHFLPFGEGKSRPGRGNILLAGDAAGFVDPITGEGIGHAIHSGELAALSVAHAIGKNKPDQALTHYRRATRPIRNAIIQARLLRPLIFAPHLQAFFARSFANSRSLKRNYMHLLSGETEYPALLLRVLTRLPAACWRNIRRKNP
ncbi:geranylgeranyl reductase family protein [Roseovarius sp. A21]|uniref:Geranylgeranyl reductase family protein n=1 Tax=Roseovarius bejariae TaxID=2576383 RepID=A0A844D069_9RHOB|nr:geranylgeranyl reductase family protein [Roseovarius bejariae]MRU15273.1 geranylgeranyl reductase family protein [Roseovarius bejariae]